MSCIYIDPAALAYVLKAATSADLHPLNKTPQTLRWFYDERWQEMAPNNPAELCRVAQILNLANLESLRSVYPGRGFQARVMIPANLSRGWVKFDPVQVIKTCDYIEYQSNDPATYKDSEAREIVRRVREIACRALPGYEAAEWGEPTN